MTPVGTLARVARGHVARAVAGTVVAIAMVAGMSPVGQAGAEPIVAQATTATPGITVTGESTVTVAPDVAYLTVGVQTSARTAREASATNATQVAAVIEAVTRADAHVMVALRAYLLIGFEVGAVQHGLAGRALDPQALGHRATRGSIRALNSGREEFF